MHQRYEVLRMRLRFVLSRGLVGIARRHPLPRGGLDYNVSNRNLFLPGSVSIELALIRQCYIVKAFAKLTAQISAASLQWDQVTGVGVGLF